MLGAAGIQVIKTPVRAPRANAYAVHWVRTARAEVTDRMLITGPRHLRTVLDKYVAHYNGHRPTRPGAWGLGPPDDEGDGFTTPVTEVTSAQIRRHEVLGGLIHEYQQAA